MHRPSESGERVDTNLGPGTFTGNTNTESESYEIDLENGDTEYLHYEDIHESAKVTRIPLDPQEGPTAWLEIREIDTAEEARVSFISGQKPWNPYQEVTLNKRESLRAAQFITDTLGDQPNP